jgi:hypothetical protein
MDPLAVITDDELTALRLLVHRAHHAIDKGQLANQSAPNWH